VVEVRIMGCSMNSFRQGFNSAGIVVEVISLIISSVDNKSLFRTWIFVAIISRTRVEFPDMLIRLTNLNPRATRLSVLCRSTSRNTNMAWPLPKGVHF
jgi:hypothetical protein